MTFRFSAVSALVMMALPVVGHAATVGLQTHDVSFHAPGQMHGRFSARDLNGDGIISGDEVFDVTGMAYNDDSSYGSWSADFGEVNTLEIVIGAARFDLLDLVFDMPVYYCTLWSDPDCFDVHGNEVRYYEPMYSAWLVDPSQVTATWRSYPAVPLPASLALLLGAVGALGAARRRPLAR